MKRLLLLAVFFPLIVQAAELLPPPPIPLPIHFKQATRFDFTSASVSEVIRLVYMEALKQAYVLDPVVLQDQRQVAFRFDAAKGDMRGFWRSFLDSLGYQLETRNGIDFVQPKPLGKTERAEVFVYRPQYRDAGYLIDVLGPLLGSGGFTSNRQVKVPMGDKSDKPAPAGSAAAMLDKDADTMVYQGSAEEIERLKKVLPQIDTPTGEVVVRGVVYEVSNSQKEGSAFNLALSVLGGKLSLGLNTATSPHDSFVSFKNATIGAVFSALSGDTRFKVVTNPHLRIKSGKSAHLTVGQDVPTLGSVSYPQGSSTPVRSVEYRSSGVIFDISPIVRDRVIELTVGQQVSDFVTTQTGVNDSPTLTKRELQTTVGLTDGELVMLGGLKQDKDDGSRSGFSFLPRLLDVSTSSKTGSELLLMLQVNKVVSN